MKRRRREPAADVEGTLEISTVIAAAPTPFKPTAAPIRVPSAAAAQAPPHDAAGMTAEVPVTKPRDPTLPFDD